MSLRSLSPWARLCSAALVFALAGCPDPVVTPDAPVTPDAGDAGRTDGGPRDGGMADGGGPVCGDGIVNGTEVCDDDNTAANDGCSATCTEETGWTCDGADPTVCTEDCGDGMVVGDEAGANGCDDGNAVTGDGCATCMVEMGWACAGAPSTCTPDCGDGAINGSEVCDDDNNADNDGCSMACQVETGWTCNTAEPTVCTSTCGDGLVAMGAETCDDTNTTAGDGCSATCATETGWNCSTGTCAPICGDGTPIAPETCDDGNAVSEECAYGLTSCSICDSTCRTSPGATRYCGDTNVDPEEACDDGNTAAADGCSAVCVVEAGYDCSSGTCAPICGDNMIVGSETCDGGNTVPGDGCDATCQIESVCGDGTIEGRETCEDGNTAAGDGCSAACIAEAGWVCTGAPPSVCVATCAAFAEATVLNCASGTVSGNIADGTSRVSSYCDGDSTNYPSNEQVWRFTNETGARVAVNIVATRDGTITRDTDVFVLPTSPLACGEAACLDSGVSTGGTETVDFVAPPGDEFFVAYDVWNTPALAAAPYTLAITCTPIVCGDGVRGLGETCDDGDAMGGDGCSATCTLEPGYTCTTANPNVCTLNCGNGTLQTGETCDDGDATSGDGCSSVCAIESGYVCTGTPSACRIPACGDGFRDAPETCDDGDTDSGDGCSALCAVESGFSCTTANPNVCTPAPTNTTCALATPVSGAASYPTLDVAFGGARPTGAGCSGGTGSRAFYWAVTVPAGQIASITTTGTIDRVLSIQTDCAATTCSFSTDSSPEAGTINNASGTLPITRIVSVYSYSSFSSGTLGVNFTFVTPPPPPAVTTITASCVTTGTWTSLSRSGTSDDATTAIAALPFTFRYFGTDVTHFSTSTNGFAQLWTSSTGTPSSAFGNVAIPNAATPNGVVAAFWDDMYLGGAFDIRTQTTGSAGSRIFTIEWRDALVGSGGSPVTFQLQFSEAADVIEAHYCAVGAGTRASGSLATIGVEDLGGLSGANVSFDTAGSVVAGSGYRFTF